MLNNVGPGETVWLESLPRFGVALLSARRQHAQEVFAHSSMRLFTRGFDISSWLDWRAVFDYRFVNPDLRWGVRSNYSERLRGAEGVILTEANTAIYRSRWQPERHGGIQFRFVPEIRSAVCPSVGASGFRLVSDLRNTVSGNRPFDKAESRPGYAGERACATMLDQEFAAPGGAGIQPAGFLPRAARQ
jgi:hypothetical protein